jgi:hypothetical protein
MNLNDTGLLELTDGQFKKLSVPQKLDVLYMNIRHIAGIRRLQKMQWWALGGLGSAVAFLFLELWTHVKGV